MLRSRSREWEWEILERLESELESETDIYLRLRNPTKKQNVEMLKVKQRKQTNSRLKRINQNASCDK